ncbi:transforming growth factor beta like domain-containing protein [Ditylenchus destructor]|nr:transforming growth factor beta like domain-containing protein [Ditylenchus destructor]
MRWKGRPTSTTFTNEPRPCCSSTENETCDDSLKIDGISHESYARSKDFPATIECATTPFRHHPRARRRRKSHQTIASIDVSTRHFWIDRLRFIYLFVCFTLVLPTTNATLLHYTDQERQIVRNLFLKKFGLADLADHIRQPQPKLTAQQQMPAYVWDLYDQVEQGHAELIRHYYPSITVPVGVPNGWRLNYNLSAVGRNSAKEQILRADLRLPLAIGSFSLPAIDNSSQQLERINVYEVDQDNPDVVRLIDTRLVPLTVEDQDWRAKKHRKTNDKWVDFDVTEALSRRRHDMDKAEFLVERYLEGHAHHRIRRPIDGSTSQQSAALVVFADTLDDDTESVPGRRVKRNVVMKARRHRKHRKHNFVSRDSTQCRRSELYVDFAELNWQDWIMAPVGYEAYQCKGRCPHPLPSQLNTTNHAIIQSLINSIDPSAVPPPSCVPVEMSSLSILYRDINNVVVVKTYPDMKVEACGCH